MRPSALQLQETLQPGLGQQRQDEAQLDMPVQLRNSYRKKACDVLYEDIDRNKLLEEFRKEKKGRLYINVQYVVFFSSIEAIFLAMKPIVPKNIKELESRIEKLEKKSLVATKNKIINNTQNIININLRDFGNHSHLTKNFLHKCFANIENLHFDVK